MLFVGAATAVIASSGQQHPSTRQFTFSFFYGCMFDSPQNLMARLAANVII
jgi:hypothetical protein